MLTAPTSLTLEESRTRSPSSRDGALALSLVVWPPKGSRLEDERVPRERQFYSPELREEIRRRHAEGETLPELERKTGSSYASLKGLLSYDKAQAAKLARAR